MELHGLLSNMLDWMGDSPKTVTTTRAPGVTKMLGLQTLLPDHLDFHKLSLMKFNKTF